jgi:hypothetical protein
METQVQASDLSTKHSLLETQIQKISAALRSEKTQREELMTEIQELEAENAKLTQKSEKNAQLVQTLINGSFFFFFFIFFFLSFLTFNLPFFSSFFHEQ